MLNTSQLNNTKHYYRLYLVNEITIPVEDYQIIEDNLKQLGYDKILVDAVITNFND
jgi:hypothetical protein